MRKIVCCVVFLLISLPFSSCYITDPSHVSYEVSVKMKGVVENDCKYLCTIESKGVRSLVVFLEKENNYFNVFSCIGMGPQYDFKKPDGMLKEYLDKIENGSTFSVIQKNKNGDEKKFTLSYTSSDVVDITTNDSMYRKYVILLDYNKLVPVAE